MNTTLLRWLFSLCLATVCTFSWSRELKIIFAQYTPPYFMDNGKGIVADIVREALAPAGYTIDPIPVAMGRGLELYVSKQVDGIGPIRESSGLKSNYSQPFVHFHNRAIALKSHQVKLTKLADLKDKVVVGFQNSSKYLGPEYAAAVSANPNYKELANQETQTLMLLLGRIDVAIMDENIFRYYKHKLVAEGKAQATTEVEMFKLFPTTEYKCAFPDPQVRDDFDRGIVTLRNSGRYEAIYRKYLEQFVSASK